MPTFKNKILVVVPVVIVIFFAGLFIMDSSKTDREDLLATYKAAFFMGEDLSKVKSYLTERGIKFYVENSENFTTLSDDYVTKGYDSVLVFNAYSSKGVLNNFFAKTDFLIEVRFDSQGKVMNVSIKDVHTFL